MFSILVLFELNKTIYYVMSSSILSENKKIKLKRIFIKHCSYY